MENLLVPEGLTDVKPIREIIYEYLRQAILEGDIKPGERLVERDIAEKLGASRTPVREALRKLESEDFVVYIPRKGMVVKGINIQEVDELYSIRKALESLAIRCAIKNISSDQLSDLEKIVTALELEEKGDGTQSTLSGLHEFNDLVIDAAAMPTLKSFLHNLYDMLSRYKRINLSRRPRRKEAVREHKEILQAIIARDAKLAEALVCAHADRSCRELKKRLHEADLSELA